MAKPAQPQGAALVAKLKSLLPTALFTKTTTKKRPPRYKYKPPKKPFVFTIWVLVRPGVALLAALLLYVWANPLALGFVEEAHSSRAVQKGRVLLRGAQLVATQQLIDGKSWEETEAYLRTAPALAAVAEAARFPVQPVEITGVTLDKRGIITTLDCVVENEYRRYRISMDIPADQYTPTLLEKLPKPDAEHK